MSIEELNDLLKNVTLADKISHLFTADIEFPDINEKTLLFNEIYPPIFEKKKKISPHKRSTCEINSREQRRKKVKIQFQNCHLTLKLTQL